MQGTLFKFGITNEIKVPVVARMMLLHQCHCLSRILMYPFSVKFVMKSLKVSSIWIFTSFGSIIGAIKVKNRKENWKLTLVCKS